MDTPLSATCAGGRPRESTQGVSGRTLALPGQGSTAYLTGYAAECGEFFRTMYGYSDWRRCEFELYVGVNAAGRLLGI